jgi:hypothetical protein
MVRYSLRCADGHAFESWFASSQAFDDLAARNLLSCADCGSPSVTKALMAPAVAADPRAEALAALRRRVEAESDYVGLRFAAEARAIHEGRAPERSIHGEARPDEARALIEDGIPVAPLPFVPRQKAN